MFNASKVVLKKLLLAYATSIITIASIYIDVIILEHEKMSKVKYQDEMEYLVSNEKRNDFICNLIYSLKGNTLCLFQYVEKHGFILHHLMKGRVDNLHYVYGGTDTKDREEIRGLLYEIS